MLTLVDATDEGTRPFSGSRSYPIYRMYKQDNKDPNHAMCLSGKYSSCGTYSTAFSKKPAMLVKYEPGPDDGIIGFADRVLIDFVVVYGTLDFRGLYIRINNEIQ